MDVGDQMKLKQNLSIISIVGVIILFTILNTIYIYNLNKTDPKKAAEIVDSHNKGLLWGELHRP